MPRPGACLSSAARRERQRESAAELWYDGGNERPKEPTMPIKTKRWDDPRDDDDGFRLLICRYRPRALPKKKETWNLWWRHLGPSKELHAAFYGKQGEAISWDEYRRRYLEEM